MTYHWLIKAAGFLFSLSLIFAPCVGASDLDDGISMDDNIGKYDSIRTDDNIKFIKRKAKATAASGAASNTNKGAVLGGVAIGQGATIKGDVTVVFEGKNIEQTVVK